MGRPLRGTLYLRSSGKGLPDLAARLSGEGIEVIVAAPIESARGRLRFGFEELPDAPVSKLVVQLGGRHPGLLVGRANLCKANNRAGVSLVAQNGKTRLLDLPVAVACKKSSHKDNRRAHQ